MTLYCTQTFPFNAQQWHSRLWFRITNLYDDKLLKLCLQDCASSVRPRAGRWARLIRRGMCFICWACPIKHKGHFCNAHLMTAFVSLSYNVGESLSNDGLSFLSHLKSDKSTTYNCMTKNMKKYLSVQNILLIHFHFSIHNMVWTTGCQMMNNWRQVGWQKKKDNNFAFMPKKRHVLLFALSDVSLKMASKVNIFMFLKTFYKSSSLS